MNKDFDFAVQHIGEIANKVKDVVNFVNPYCESIGGTSNMNEDEVREFVKSIGFRPDPDGIDYETQLVDALTGKDTSYNAGWGAVYYNSDKVLQYLKKYGMLGSRGIKQKEAISKLRRLFKSGKWRQPEQQEQDLYNEVENTMKKTNERGGSDWVSMDDIVGMEVGESDEPINWDDEDSYNDGGFERGMWVIWTDPDTDEESVWKILRMPKAEDETSYDNLFVIGQKNGDKKEVPGWEIRPRDADPEEYNESGLENELPKGDDGWKEIGQPVSEANDALLAAEFLDKMLEDAEDTDDVFDVYDGNVIEDGTVALNVTVYKEDVEDGEVEAEFKDMPTKYGWEYECFAYSNDLPGEEGTETIVVYFRPTKQRMDEASVVVDANDVWDVLDLLDDEVANKNLTDLINSHVRTEEEIMDAIDSCYPDGVRKGELNAYMKDSFYEIVDELGLDVEKFKRDGQFVEPEKPVTLEDGKGEEQKPDEVKDGEKKYKKDGETKTLVTGSDKENKEEMTNVDAATIMGGASETDMDAADMGLISHKVADPYNKKKVTEMTIEQEITDPWKLLELLWGQGKENFEELLRSNLFSDDMIMDTLEQFEVRDLTNLNDLLAYDFEQVLDAFGCDVEAWTQHLEIQKA